MPTTSTGIYELVLEQTYQGQAARNVFHYLHTLGQDDEQDKCGEAFNNDVMASLANTQNVGVDYTNIRVANLTGILADTNTIPVPTSGTVIGDEVVGFTAYPLRYNRVTKDTRNGAKRFTGLVEENVKTTGFEVAFFALMQSVATILGQPITSVGAIFGPIILHKPADGAGVFTYNDVASVTALNRTTTQNSRKAF